MSSIAGTLEVAAMRPCPVCAGEKFQPTFGPIQRCRRCGLAMLNPPAEIRGENESEEYFVHEYLPLMLAHREASMGERRWHLDRIGKAFRLPPAPRLLDVGCALGFMLDEAKTAGWQARGVETSEFAAQYARERTNCEVHAGTLEDACFPENSFDVVTLMDVIEHMPEPVHLLNEVLRVLSPGGVAYIVTPNFSSFFVWLYGLRAYAIWPDQHVVYFNRASISRLLLQTGFMRTRVITKDFYAPNLERLLGRTHSRNEMKAVFAERPLFRKMRKIANVVFSHVPLGDKLIACAQK